MSSRQNDSGSSAGGRRSGPGPRRGSGPTRGGGSSRSGGSRGGRGRDGDSQGRGGRGEGRGRRSESGGNPADKGRGVSKPRRPSGPRANEGKSIGGRRVPPPPRQSSPEREKEVWQRVDDDDRRQIRKPSKRRAQKLDLSHVKFSGADASTVEKSRGRLAEAAVAYEAERFGDAERLLKQVEKLTPGVAEVHELMGLCYYRMGRWIKALNELEVFTNLTGSVEQHAVMADCSRALQRWNKADDFWAELRAESPSADLIEEGRIVNAGCLADRGRLTEAIASLESGPKPRNPSVHHLRRWYALADLYERTGDFARSRRVFGRILEFDDEFGDVEERIESLG